jgi:hypothetical protein
MSPSARSLGAAPAMSAPTSSPGAISGSGPSGVTLNPVS